MKFDYCAIRRDDGTAAKPAEVWAELERLRELEFEKRLCYVCGTRADDGCCGGVDGERFECPWY